MKEQLYDIRAIIDMDKRAREILEEAEQRKANVDKEVETVMQEIRRRREQDMEAEIKTVTGRAEATLTAAFRAETDQLQKMTEQLERIKAERVPEIVDELLRDILQENQENEGTE